MSAQRPGGRLRPALSLLMALLCAGAVAAMSRVAVGTASGQRADQLTLSGAQSHQGLTSEVAQIAVGSISTPVVAAVLVLSVLLVLLRCRPRALMPLGVLVVGANLTTQVIKHLVLTRDVLGPGIEVTPNSFPSGHTTVAAAAAITLALASGPGRPVLAPLGAVWTAASGIGTLVLGWHRPSDVAGAILVVAAWTFLVLAIDGARTRRRAARAGRVPAQRSGHGRRRAGTPAAGTTAAPARTGRADVAAAIVLALAGLAALALGVIAAGDLQLPLILDDAAQQEAAFVAAAALIGGGTASWMALVLVLRTPTGARTTAGERVP